MFIFNNIFPMLGTYESRKVELNTYSWGFISTARVTDGSLPYETAIEHKQYNEGKIIIVDAYLSIEEAQDGHLKWIKIMTEGELPNQLTDIANSECQQYLGRIDFPRKR